MEAQEGQNWPPVGGRRAPGWADTEAEEEERKIRKKKEKKRGTEGGAGADNEKGGVKLPGPLLH